MQFTLLQQLHETLLAKYPAAMQGIRFPPKKVWRINLLVCLFNGALVSLAQALGNRAQAFVDERRMQLNCYLQAIIRIPALAEAPEIRAALALCEAGVADSSREWLDELPPRAEHPGPAKSTIWDQDTGSFITELAVEVRFCCHQGLFIANTLVSLVCPQRGASRQVRVLRLVPPCPRYDECVIYVFR